MINGKSINSATKRSNEYNSLHLAKTVITPRELLYLQKNVFTKNQVKSCVLKHILNSLSTINTIIFLTPFIQYTFNIQYKENKNFIFLYYPIVIVLYSDT